MNSAGASMIELLVAVAIVGVGVAGVASLTATAARTLVRASALDEARMELQSFVDSIARLEVRVVGSGERINDAGVLRWSIVASPEFHGWASFEHVALPADLRIEFVMRSVQGREGP